jgi:hypothetical protein
MPPAMTMKTANNHIAFNQLYDRVAKTVAVFDLTGRRVAVKTLVKNTVDLRKDLGVPDGVYIVKVKPLQ